jgi:cystathionine beta-lyase/cystathionine gamma-synthase
MEAHSANALALAAFLERHPAVSMVRYAGLANHPDRAVAARLVGDRCGGMMSIRLHGGRRAMFGFANRLRLCSIAVSLGDVFTLVYPMPKRDDLVRISVGCEDPDDIVGDFRQALAGG